MLRLSIAVIVVPGAPLARPQSKAWHPIRSASRKLRDPRHELTFYAFRLSHIPFAPPFFLRGQASKGRHKHGRRNQSPQCEDSLQQVHGLLLLDPYVLPASRRPYPHRNVGRLLRKSQAVRMSENSEGIKNSHDSKDNTADCDMHTDFWGPASNFGIPIAAIADMSKDPEMYVFTLLSAQRLHRNPQYSLTPISFSPTSLSFPSPHTPTPPSPLY